MILSLSGQKNQDIMRVELNRNKSGYLITLRHMAYPSESNSSHPAPFYIHTQVHKIYMMKKVRQKIVAYNDNSNRRVLTCLEMCL